MRRWWAQVRDPAEALGLALAVHVLAALLMVLGTMNWQPFKEVQPAGLTIEAVIVDTARIEAERREAEEAQRRAEAQERRAQELEQQRERERQAEQQRQREAEQERQRQLQEQQQREAAEAERRRQEQERLQQLRERQERERQEQIERQQRELEELRRQREEIERQRRLEEERLKQIEARRQAEAQAQREAEAEARAQAEAAAAARAERIGSLHDAYVTAIRQLVTSNWLRPPTARPGLRCTLKVVQIPGGEVISATISGACNGDEATRRSLIAAVERSGNLPYRTFEDVFQREIEFIFTYDGD